MNTRLPLVAALALAPALASANINIVFDYTYDTGGFFGTTQKSILESAANVFESRITDELGAITSSGGNHYDFRFFDPRDPNQSLILSDRSVGNDELRIFVGASDLGGSTLGEGGPGGASALGSPAFIASLNRGQTGVATQTDFAPWGGFLSFSNRTDWYFDSNTNTLESFSGPDFYSVAIHEISHVLGFGTSASWNRLVVNPAAHTYNGTYGGTQPLNSNNDHWLNGLTSTINGSGSFETAMDPSILLGTRKELTDLDWNALRDIGWQVAAVPEPETWAMLLAGLAVVSAGVARRRS